MPQVQVQSSRPKPKAAHIAPPFSVLIWKDLKGSGSESTVRGTVESRGRPSAVEARDRFPSPAQRNLSSGRMKSLRDEIRCGGKGRISFHREAMLSDFTFAARQIFHIGCKRDISFFCIFVCRRCFFFSACPIFVKICQRSTFLFFILYLYNIIKGT